MTIRIEHLTISPADDAWLRAPEDGSDATLDETRRFDILAVVRHIMRERGDCDQIPVVIAFVTHPTNRWGHNAEIEVNYSTKGYRAIYGAHLGERVTHVQCYMD